MRNNKNHVFAYEIPKMVIPPSEIKKEEARKAAREKRLEIARQRELAKEEKLKEKELKKLNKTSNSKGSKKKEIIMIEEVKPGSHVRYSLLLAIFFAVTLACCLLGVMPSAYSLKAFIENGVDPIINEYKDLVQYAFSMSILEDVMSVVFTSITSLLRDVCYVLAALGSLIGFLCSLIKIKKHKKNMSKSLFLVISAFLGMLVSRLATDSTFVLINLEQIKSLTDIKTNYPVALKLGFLVLAVLSILQNTATSRFRETRFINLKKRNSALGYLAFASAISFALIAIIVNPITTLISLISGVLNIIATKSFTIDIAFIAAGWIGFIGMAPSAHKLLKAGLLKPFGESDKKMKKLSKASKTAFVFSVIACGGFVANMFVGSGTFTILGVVPAGVPIVLMLGTLFSANKVRRNCVKVD